MLKTYLRLIALLGVALLLRAEAPTPESCTALVIGNADYSFAPLRNPINDAEAMATALKAAGFEVIVETDADQAEMVQAVRSFGAELRQKGGVGLFYFSGHGTQIDGENYLLPVGHEFASLEDVKRGSVTALAVVDAMATGRSDLNIVILDACRNNPIDPNGAKGLSRIDSNARLFISYATSPGLTALDGAGNNSWEVGSSSYEGNGILAGNLLTVDWGSSTPVVYALGPDGSLTGLWDAGQGRRDPDARVIGVS